MKKISLLFYCLVSVLLFGCEKDDPSIVESDYIEDGVNYGPGVVIDGITWAPVNLGYKKAAGSDKGYPFGKLYQWGRKIGQGYESYESNDNIYGGPYRDATIPIISDGPLAYKVNPNDIVFYLADRYTWLWMQQDKDGTKPFDEHTDWNSLTGLVEKVANPCPKG